MQKQIEFFITEWYKYNYMLKSHRQNRACEEITPRIGGNEKIINIV